MLETEQLINAIDIEHCKNKLDLMLDKYAINYNKIEKYMFHEVYIEIKIKNKIFKGMLSINLLSILLNKKAFTIYRIILRKKFQTIDFNNLTINLNRVVPERLIENTDFISIIRG